MPKFDQFAAKVIEEDIKGNKKLNYLAKSGLTAPTKNIRSRFFRKNFPVSRDEVREVEREIMDILKVR